MGRGERRHAVSFRLATDIVDELKQKAERERAAQTALVERYLKEGMRHDAHPLIHFRDSAGGRRPSLPGSRLGVADVITTIRQNNGSVAEAADYLEVPREQIEAAVSYYADYKSEIDAEIEQAEAIAREERERWQRQQEALD